MKTNRLAQVTISPAVNFVPMTEDDRADIRALFTHTPRTFAADKRDLQEANRRQERKFVSFPDILLASGNTP